MLASFENVEIVGLMTIAIMVCKTGLAMSIILGLAYITGKLLDYSQKK